MITKYDTLCSDLADRQNYQLAQTQKANQIATQFRSALVGFLGLDGDAGMRIVFLRKVKFDDGGDVVVTDEKGWGGTMDFALPDRNYDWVFAIDLQLRSVTSLCRCSIDMSGEEVKLCIGNIPTSYPLVPGDPEPFEPALEALHQRMRHYLQWRPSMDEPEPQLQIGFDLRRNR